MKPGTVVWYCGDKPGLIGRRATVVALVPSEVYGMHVFIKAGTRIGLVLPSTLAVVR